MPPPGRVRGNPIGRAAALQSLTPRSGELQGDIAMRDFLPAATSTRIFDLSALSPQRVVAMSTTLSLHLLALALLLIPPAPLLPTPVVRNESILAEWIARVQSEPLPVPPMPQPPVPPRPTPRVHTPAPMVPVIATESVFVIEAAPVETTTAVETAAPATQWRGAQIAYEHAPPPPYPSLAQRRGWEGEVILRVLVDASGRASEVEILRSSGHGLLDRSARDQVLQRWRFQPAMRNGETVSAWAEVPVRFRLQSG